MFICSCFFFVCASVSHQVIKHTLGTNTWNTSCKLTRGQAQRPCGYLDRPTEYKCNIQSLKCFLQGKKRYVRNMFTNEEDQLHLTTRGQQSITGETSCPCSLVSGGPKIFIASYLLLWKHLHPHISHLYRSPESLRRVCWILVQREL